MQKYATSAKNAKTAKNANNAKNAEIVIKQRMNRVQKV